MNRTWHSFAPVVHLLESLGKDLLRWREEPAARQVHSSISFTTEADLRADNYLKEGLSRCQPGVPILSEEDSAPDQTTRPGTYWLLDPIDGTASWRGGYSGFVTQAALLEAGRPIYGLVHAPALGRTWEALAGEGARLQGRELPRRQPSSRCLLVDNTPQPHGLAALLNKKLPTTGYLESGSLGLKAVLVADGSADLFVKRVPVRDWDLAPAAVVLAEVGALLTTASGEPWPFDGSMLKTQGLIAARDPDLLERTLAVLKRLDAEIRPTAPKDV